MLARQHALATPPAIFMVNNFELGSCCMPWPACTVTLLYELPYAAVMTGEHHHIQLLTEIGSCCLPGLRLKYDPLDFCLLRS
jgi:hypothetical protein